MRVAVPNKGRLKEPTTGLLAAAGLSFEQTDRSLTVPVRNVDLQLLFVRTEDVPEMVADGVAELGITGLDLLADSQLPLPVLAELGYGRCRLAAAVPADSPTEKIDDLSGGTIATSHTRFVEAFLADRGLEVTVIQLKGSIELAPKLGVADAVVDLISSGSTMLINGLRPIETLLESEAVLISGEPTNPTVQQVATMLRAVVAGRRKRYLLMNVPNQSLAEVEELIPGLDAPSVVPLATNGMSAVHSVVEADRVWNLLPQLKEAGATGILVLPIEQLIP